MVDRSVRAATDRYIREMQSQLPGNREHFQALSVLTVNPKSVKTRKIVTGLFFPVTDMFRRYWIRREWIMVVLRTSIILFNG